MTRDILFSSFEACQQECPKGHGTIGQPCLRIDGITNNRYVCETVVCTERRALVNITRPGQKIRVNIDIRKVTLA